MTNKLVRETAIEDVVRNWIGQDGADLGQLISTGTFADLQEQVSNLYGMSKSEKWRKGILKWGDCIQTAVETFGKENEFSDTAVWGNGIDSYTHATGLIFARMIKWAVHQGSTYAHMGN